MQSYGVLMLHAAMYHYTMCVSASALTVPGEVKLKIVWSQHGFSFNFS